MFPASFSRLSNPPEEIHWIASHRQDSSHRWLVTDECVPIGCATIELSARDRRERLKDVVRLLKVSERRWKNTAKTFLVDQLRAQLRDVQIVSDHHESFLCDSLLGFVCAVEWVSYWRTSRFYQEYFDKATERSSPRERWLEVASAPSTEIYERDECNRRVRCATFDPIFQSLYFSKASRSLFRNATFVWLD